MQLPKIIISCGFLIGLVGIVGCTDVDPNAAITEKNVANAIKKFNDSEKVKIQALGGPKYLIGKTINSAKTALVPDYQLYEQQELVKNEKFNRKANLELLAVGKLTVATVKTDPALSQREKKLEVTEVGAHEAYLKKLAVESERPTPMGSLVLAKGALTCRRLQDSQELYGAKLNSPAEYNKIRARKIRRKECHVLPSEKKLKIRETVELPGTTGYLTARGWSAKEEVKSLPTQQELEELALEQNTLLKELKTSPSPEFHFGYRPLVSVSPADKTRIQLAKKAVGLNMREFGEDWQQASERFVKEQKAFALSEYRCYFDKDCKENDRLNLRMAHYVYEPEIKGINYGALPCEVLPISGCKSIQSAPRS